MAVGQEQMNISDNYRTLHESLIMNQNGTSLWENYLMITPAPIMVYFACMAKYFIYIDQTNLVLWVFLCDFILLVHNILLNFTILIDYLLFSVVLVIGCYAVSVKFYINRMNRWQFIFPQTKSGPRPYLTYFRSIVNIMTSISILAVDFHIFPRRLAKTESFGFGLMDTGVGFFVILHGIVCKFNEERIFIKSVISSLPILFLGVIRYVSLRSVDYQMHVSEYGVHWNFFFTLAFVKIFSSLLIQRYPHRIILMSISVAVVHQIVLFIIVQNWVLAESPRTNFITANKEGLTSLPGYISLYLSGVVIGKCLDNPRIHIVDYFRKAMNCIIWSVIFLFITLISYLLFDVSRRLANLTYITWLISMSLYGLALSIFTELSLRISLNINDDRCYKTLTPLLFLALNQNSLLYFLLSNIFTGIINLLFRTFHIGTIFSIFILVFYQFCVCIIMCELYFHKIKIKFW